MKPITTFVFICFALITTETQAAQTTIGQWCDRMVPNAPKYNRIMTIIKNDKEKYYLDSKFADGSTKFDRIEALNETTFFKDDSSQSMYMISSYNQNLALADKAGHIRDATPIKSENARKECLGGA